MAVPATRSRRDSASTARMALIAFVVVAAWLGMGYRLFEIQVVRAEELAEEGLSQRLVTRPLAPQRGKIYDRNGNLLAMTVESKSIFAVPDQVTEPLWVAQQIGGLLGVDSEELYERLISDRDFVYIKRQVDGVLAEQVLAEEMPGVFAHPEPSRIYPAGPVASHVTGFVNIDGDGQEGLELVYDDELRGVPGHAEYERDIAGRVIPQGYTNIVPAVPGNDLTTTIDLPLQYQAQESCVDAVERTGAKSCWAVVLEVETGEILAMVGAPVFDPETRQTIAKCDSAEDPAACRMFTNFVVRGIYEPGSTQKMITFAAALEEGVVDVGTLIPNVDDELEVLEGACDSTDDESWGCYEDFDEHEATDMTVADIFTRSSNVGTIKVAEKLGQPQLIEYIEKFGFGEKTGVDYTVEAPGILRFDAGCQTCLPSAAIGYSVAVTPLQMAAAYAAVGNEGVWTTPHIVRTQVDAEGEAEVAGIETRRVVSPGTALLMRELLASVVEKGTGTAGAVDGYRVGGKTGTANKLNEDGTSYTDETRASFVGLAPINDPKVVVAVVVDSPDHDFRTGGLSAAPVFSEIMEQALHRLGVSPDGEQQ